MRRISEPNRLNDQRLAEAAVNLLALGAGFTLAPLFLGASVFGRALSTLMPLGLLVAAVGGLLLWLARTADGSIGWRTGCKTRPPPR